METTRLLVALMLAAGLLVARAPLADPEADFDPHMDVQPAETDVDDDADDSAESSVDDDADDSRDTSVDDDGDDSREQDVDNVGDPSREADVDDDTDSPGSEDEQN